MNLETRPPAPNSPESEPDTFGFNNADSITDLIGRIDDIDDSISVSGGQETYTKAEMKLSVQEAYQIVLDLVRTDTKNPINQITLAHCASGITRSAGLRKAFERTMRAELESWNRWEELS